VDIQWFPLPNLFAGTRVELLASVNIFLSPIKCPKCSGPSSEDAGVERNQHVEQSPGHHSWKNVAFSVHAPVKYTFVVL
jgi:hypothetical protein